MLARRVIACLDVRGARVVKGVGFEGLRDAGDPVALAERYEREGADEIVFLDVAAAGEDRATLLDTARRAAERLFIPLTIGGGVRTVADAAAALRAGADKVSVNSAAVARPGLMRECADRFGAQAVVASIDAKTNEDGGWEVFTHGGTRSTGLDTVEWAEQCAGLGAGEILLTSVDRDGSRSGYDLRLLRAVAQRVSVPVIASGGAGSPGHVGDALAVDGVDAALVAGMLHDGSCSIGEIKSLLRARGIATRWNGDA
jgi:cyclase